MEKDNKKEQKKSLFKKVMIGLGIGASAAIAIVCALKARKVIKEKNELANIMQQHVQCLYGNSPYMELKFNEEIGEIECTVNNAFKEMVVRNAANNSIDDFIKQFVIPK
ncbi:MAG: hypothetical protein NC453_14870 [Muribaculum sp.]|nr:hypothetical protein [Muribaculum sp.]